MATGDAAAAAGLLVVPPTKDKRLGYDDINKRGDELANHMVNGGHPFTKITGTTTTAQIGNNTITTAKLVDANVTTAKMALLSVTNAVLANLSVSTGKVQDKAITTAKINDNAVTTTQIANLAVTTAKVADGAITNAKLGAAAVDGAKLATTLTKSGTWNIEATALVLRDTTNTDKLTVGGGFDLRTNQDGLIKTDGVMDLDSAGEITIDSDEQVYINSGFSTQIDAATAISITSHDGSITLDADDNLNLNAGTGNAVHLDAGSGEFHVGSDTDGARVWSPSIYSRTYSGSGTSPVVITTAGTLGRSTSSRRYKVDIVDADPMPSVIEIQPRTWADKNDPGRARQFGAIAEELHDLGLSDLVVYNAENQPEAIAYDRVAIALIPIIKDLAQRLAVLEGGN